MTYGTDFVSPQCQSFVDENLALHVMIVCSYFCSTNYILCAEPWLLTHRPTVTLHSYIVLLLLCDWYDYYLIKCIILSTSVFPLLFASLFGWVLDLVNKSVISCHEFVVNFPWLLPICTNPAINFELFPWICTDLINASSNRIIVLVSFFCCFSKVLYACLHIRRWCCFLCTSSTKDYRFVSPEAYCRLLTVILLFFTI